VLDINAIAAEATVDLLLNHASSIVAKPFLDTTKGAEDRAAINLPWLAVATPLRLEDSFPTVNLLTWPAQVDPKGTPDHVSLNGRNAVTCGPTIEPIDRQCPAISCHLRSRIR
jgi:hypothetical protein